MTVNIQNMQSKKILKEQQSRAQRRRCIKGVVVVAVFCDANNGGASNRAANQSKQASMVVAFAHASCCLSGTLNPFVVYQQ